MLWNRIIWLFILFLLGQHYCFPVSPRYLELADSADFYIERKNWIKAEETILKALKLEPANFTNALLLSNLGLVQSEKGDYEKALQSLSLGLSLSPSSTVILNNRAHVYLLLDSMKLAVNDLNLSLELDSIQEWTTKTRALLYLHENNTDSAIFLVNQIKKYFPDHTDIYTISAAIAEKEGRYLDASQYYKKALQINAEDEECREALILVLIKNNDYSGARLCIKEGLQINPENPMFYLLRGYLHKINFLNEEAQADKKIAISKGLSPQYVENFIP